LGEKRYNEVKGWETQFQNDPKANEMLRQAREVLNPSGTPEEVERLKFELNRTGLGSFPPLIKMLARFAPFVR
jgi:hypothetical protein